MEKFWASILVIPIFMWYSYHSVLERDFRIRQQTVENMVYQYTQIAAKKGSLYNSVYDELERKLASFGDFSIGVMAEKFSGNNDIPVVLTGSQVIGRDLRLDGYDIISIYAESVKEHPLGRLYNITPFGGNSGAGADVRIFARASVYIQ